MCQLRRAHPGWGPQRLGYELERKRVRPVPSRVTIWRILARNGLIDQATRRRRRRDDRPWERQRPMSLWQLDIMGGVWLADGTELKLVTGLDDHSRFCVLAHLAVEATGRAICQALVGALRAYGLPGEILTDNGKQFTGKYAKPRPVEVLFDRILRDNGIVHRLTRVRSPTTTGKIERFHKTCAPSCWPTTGRLPASSRRSRRSTRGSPATTTTGPIRCWGWRSSSTLPTRPD